MIPMFWFETLVNVYATVITAFITGGDPVLRVDTEGLSYGVRYTKH